MPNCSSTMLLELLDAQRRLGLGDLVAVQRVGQRGDPGVERGDLLARRGHRGRRAAGARRPARRGVREAAATTPLQPLRRPGARTRRPRPPPSAACSRAARARWARNRASRSAAAARRSESARPRTAFARSSAVRTASRASTSAARAASAAACDLADGRRVRRRRRSGPPAALCSRASSSVSSSTVCVRPASSSSRWRDQPLPLVVGGAGLLAEPAQLFVDRRDRGVGFVERGQRLLGGVLPGRLLGQRTGQRRRQLADLASRRRRVRVRAFSISEAISSVLGLRSEPPLTQPAPTRSPSSGDRPQLRAAPPPGPARRPDRRPRRRRPASRSSRRAAATARRPGRAPTRAPVGQRPRRAARAPRASRPARSPRVRRRPP